MDSISVIVPIYKVERYLRKCIESIQQQTYRNLEIILVDDGSPDRCGQICDDYAKDDSRIVVIHKKNGGLSSARNAGLEVAKGDYIGFVDSDDYIEPYMYEELINAIKRNDSKLAVCAINYVFENGHKISKSKDNKNRNFEFFEAIKEMNTYELFDMGAWSKLYKKELFDEIRFPEDKLSEDFFVMYKIFDKAQKVTYVAKPCYNYLQRSESITKSKKINKDFVEAAYKQMLYLDDKYPELEVLAHTSYASSALTVYDFYLKNKVKCPNDVYNNLKKIVFDNNSYINKADYLSKAKRIQFKLFRLSKTIYNIVFITYRKIKKV